MKRLLFLVAPLLLSAAPKAPTDLTLTPSTDSVRLDWKDRASNEHGYKIYRDGDLIAITSENISTYTDQGLRPNKRYKYTLKSTDDILNAVNDVNAKVDNNMITLEVKGLFSDDSKISFFIDSDNNPNTGFSKDDTNIKGADYLLQANKIYRYPNGANGWKWEKVDAQTTKEYHPTSMKVRVSLDDIPHAQTINYMGQVASHDYKKLNHFRSMTSLNLTQNSNADLALGARSVKSTDINKATMFASVDGNGELCSKVAPCSIESAFSKLKASDVLFLRGGVYNLDRTLTLNNSGEKDSPIIIESYPNEVAILDGGYINPGDIPAKWNDRPHGIVLNGVINYVQIRKIEIKNMARSAIYIRGSHNLVEGCNIHHNFSAGIGLIGKDWKIDELSSTGYNIIRDNQVHDNSDVGLAPDGGNADGIWVGSGQHNRVVHNNVYHNSDDGIDAWRSTDSYFAYNISYKNGIAHGDGNGFKLGGHEENNRPYLDTKIGLRAVAEYNIAYDNKANGFEFNSGIDVIMNHNTAYNNGMYGYTGCKLARTKASNNISSLNSLGHTSSRSEWGGAFDSVDNSWQISDVVEFVSTDPNSKDFLAPLNNADFKNMGVYSN
jgi:hypothetical protein